MIGTVGTCPPFLLQLGYGESQMLDKLLYEEEVKRCMACFEQQFHYGVFYAYMKLREQEIRNIMWISECVAQVGAGIEVWFRVQVDPSSADYK